jgi:signal transduction histidine kinase
MISAVRTAIAARRRQYEVRDHLRQRTAAEDALRSARDTLETIVEDRTVALRRLSAQLLKVQDEERRRIARELHDSLGQYLAAIKINLGLLAFGHGDQTANLNEVQQLLDRAIAETRTLSHLLHPPSLDLAGFASAASWYVEGFAKRSGIRASLKLPENLTRLPVSVETALFRIMQEALTNAHRHSQSQVVEISLAVDDSLATLTVVDFGKGIPKEVLDGLNHSGTNVGVGLAGIRERTKELGGTFEVESGPTGTTLKASVPLAARNANVFEADPPSQIYSSLVS